MPLSLDLPPDLERRLCAEAERLGLSPAGEALRILDTTVPPEVMPVHGAELLAYWEREGVLGIWADRTHTGDSAEYARKLRRQAERRAES